MLVELSCRIPNPVKSDEKYYLLNGRKLIVADSYAVVPISNAFNHGFRGTSSLQLALAICLELFGSEAAKRLYCDFRDDHIAELGHYTAGESQQEAFTALLDVTKYADRANSLPPA
jgi:hypothetical protein